MLFSPVLFCTHRPLAPAPRSHYFYMVIFRAVSCFNVRLQRNIFLCELTHCANILVWVQCPRFVHYSICIRKCGRFLSSTLWAYILYRYLIRVQCDTFHALQPKLTAQLLIWLGSCPVRECTYHFHRNGLFFMLSTLELEAAHSYNTVDSTFTLSCRLCISNRWQTTTTTPFQNFCGHGLFLCQNSDR